MSYNESGGASEDGRDKGQWLLMSSNDSIYEYDIAQVCCLNYRKYIVKNLHFNIFGRGQLYWHFGRVQITVKVTCKNEFEIKESLACAYNRIML